jgi:hypothetical protein
VRYKDSAGRLGHELLYRDREPTLEAVTEGRLWSFDGDGALFRLVSEAHRIQLAHLFDPLLAVHTSLVDPQPHQITAVYDEMIARQPLRSLLADDPGAGKTIMTGLLIRELIARGDLNRCLIVSPGSLVEQWQDEMDDRFRVPFEIMTNDKLEAARTGNWFSSELIIAAVQNGIGLLSWQNDSFAYAEGWDEQKGRYKGLRAGQSGHAMINADGLIVKPDVAAAQLEVESQVRLTAGSVDTGPTLVSGTGSSITQPGGKGGQTATVVTPPPLNCAASTARSSSMRSALRGMSQS